VSTLPRFTRRPRRHAFVAFALVSSLVLGTMGTASAAKTPSTPTEAAPHCLTRVTGKLASGELQLSTPTCYATMAEVLLNAAGGGAVNGRSSGGGVAAFGTFIIGTHFDGFGFTGASISVQGSDCYGGYINLTGWWANRVSSTINGCPAIVHYYWPNLGGTFETTYGGGGDLTYMNNLSESIAYSGW
jgi:hypothetical protein